MTFGMGKHAARLEEDWKTRKAGDAQRAARSFSECSPEELRLNESFYDGERHGWASLSAPEMRDVLVAELHRRGLERTSLENECPT